MRVLGVRFERDQQANAALRALRERFDLRDEDAAVRPLGTTRYDDPTSDLILAGRFRPEVLPDVMRLVHELGGRIVVDRDEWSGPQPWRQLSRF